MRGSYERAHAISTEAQCGCGSRRSTGFRRRPAAERRRRDTRSGRGSSRSPWYGDGRQPGCIGRNSPAAWRSCSSAQAVTISRWRRSNSSSLMASTRAPPRALAPRRGRRGHAPSGGRPDGVEQDQGVSCDSRLPDFFRREVGSKANGTDWWQRRQAKSFQALLVEHCPRRHDPAKPIPDSSISAESQVLPRCRLHGAGCRAESNGAESHSFNFDQRRRPDTFFTAMATAFFCPTRTTSRLPRVTPV